MVHEVLDYIQKSSMHIVLLKWALRMGGSNSYWALNTTVLEKPLTTQGSRAFQLERLCLGTIEESTSNASSGVGMRK